MEKTTSLDVLIDGQVYTLQGDEPEEYFQQIANYLNRKINEVRKLAPLGSRLDLTTLYLVINIVDDLFKQRAMTSHITEESQTLDLKLNQYMDELAKLTEENLLLQEKLSETMLLYQSVKQELNDYIENFPMKG